MNKTEFLMALYDTLNDIPSELRTDIVSEYKEYFESELEKGKTEEEIIMELGDPITLAYAAKLRRGYGEQYNQENNRTHNKPKKSSGKLIGIVLLIFGVVTIVTTFAIHPFGRSADNSTIFGKRESYDIDSYEEINIHSIEKIIIKTTSANTLVETTSQDDLTCLLKGKVKTSNKDYIPTLNIDTSGDTLIIDVMNPEKNNVVLSFSSNLKLSIEIPEAFKGDIEYRGHSGNLEVSDLKLDNLSLAQTSGNIKVDNIESDGTFKVSSASGNNSITNTHAQNIQYKSTSGNASFKKIYITDTVEISNTSGNINIYDSQINYLSISSISGDIEIDDQIGSTEIKSTSGDIDLNYSKIDGNIYIKSISGDIYLYLPKKSDFYLSCKSTSANIYCEFELKDMSKDKRSLSGIYGQSKNNISISATAGDIHIKEE